MEILKKYWDKKYTLFILLFIFVAFQMGKVKPEYLYSSDNLLKLIQSQSLLENHFLSENLTYPAIAIDPEYKLYPHYEPIHLRNIFIGQYPVFLSLLLAPFLKLVSFSFVPYIFLIICFAVLFTLIYYWDITKISQVMFLLGTPFILNGFEVSEHPPMLLFQSIGLYLAYKSFQEQKDIGFWAGLFMGLGIWLRLEVLFYCFFFAGFLFIHRFKLKIIDFIKTEYLFLLGLSFAIFSFLIFNQINYNHYLGPRYLYNQSGFFSNLQDKLSQSVVLLLGGDSKLGFFRYTPVFLLVYGLFFFPFRNREIWDKLLLHSVLGFLPVIAFLSPNDGVVNWGSRYMNLALIPSILLLDTLYKELDNRKIKILFYICLVYSYFVTQFGWKVMKNSSKILQTFQQEFQKCGDRYRVFPFVLYAEYQGLDFFTKPSLVIRNPENYEYFKQNLSRDIQSLCVIAPSKFNPAVLSLNGVAYKEEERRQVEELFIQEWKLEKEESLQFNRILIYKK